MIKRGLIAAWIALTSIFLFASPPASAQTAQTITFPSPGSQIAGSTFSVSATASSGLAVTFTSSTPTVCTVSGSGSESTVKLGAVFAGTCIIDANQAGNSTYAAAAQVAQSIAIASRNQSLWFDTVSAQTYGAAPFALSSNSSSGLAVTITSSTPAVCTVSGSTVTLVGVGTCTIVASQAGNGTYAAAQITQSFAVAGESQAITFAALSGQTYGAAPFSVSATASSGLGVTFTSSTTAVCTVSGSTVTLVGAGTCTIDADQAGNSIYAAALEVARSFTVAGENKAQTIAFAALSGQAFGVAPFAVSATASSGLAVTFTSSTTAVCTVSGSTVTLVGVGTCTIAASQAGNSIYAAAPQVAQSFAVGVGSQSISFPSPGNQLVPGSFFVSATASSGLPVTFTSGTPKVCGVSGSTVSVGSPGTCTINANQAGNSNYAAAPQVAQSFLVAIYNQTISFGSLPDLTYGAAPFAVSATASSGRTVTFTSGTPAVCTVSGSTVTLVGLGTCTIDANQAGNTSYLPAPQVAQSFAVSQGASQTITFPSPGNQPYGTLFTVSATTTSGLAVSFTSNTPSVCSANGSGATTGNFSPLTTGTCSITASQAGQSGVAPATPVTQTFTITPLSQTIVFAYKSASQPANPYTGALQSSFLQPASASSGLQVSFSSSTPSVCTVSSLGYIQTTVTMVGVGTCTIVADQAGNSIYSAAPEVTQSITLIATQTIGFAALPDQSFGVTPPSLTATASSGLPVSFSSLTTNTCTVSGATVTLLAGGTCSIAADQAGNGSYSAAPQVIQSFAVVLAGQSMTIAPTTTSLTVSENSVAPSQSIVLAATVAGNNPTGTVIFLDGTTVLGSATLTNGQATLATAFGAPGTFGGVGAHSVVAAYAGDSNNTTSASAPTTVNVLDLWIALTSPTGGDVYSVPANSSPYYGPSYSVYLRAQLSRASGDDIVTFNVNGQIIAATPGVTAGSYVANASLAPSSTPYSVYATVTQGSTARESSIATFTVGATGTALLTIGTPTVSGNTVNLSANATAVSGAVVQFFANGQPINTSANPATNNSGAWSYTWTNVPTGVYTISAQLVSATGATLAQQTAVGTAIVGAAPGGTALAVSATTVPNNQPMTLTASVFGNNPTGNVTFLDGATSLGSAGVSTGQATLSPQLSTAGLHSLTARYNGDANNPVSTSVPVFVQSYAVVLQNQTVSFPTIPNQTFTQSGATLTISASTSSGLPITFTYFPNWVCGANGGACVVVPGVCSVTGNTVTINTTGTCTIIAYSNGNTTYAAASAVQTFTIGATAPTVTMNAPLNGSTFDAPITLATPLANVPISGSATAGAGASIASMTVLVDGSVFGNPITGGSVNIVGMLTVGVHTVQLQATDSTGNTGSSNSASVTVLYGDGQAISFPAPSGTYGPAPFTVSATASSGLPVTFSTTTPAICSVSGTTVTILATGTCVVAADQAGNATYLAAPEVTQSFTVVATNSTLTPTVTLSVPGSSVAISSGTTAAVTFTGSGAEASGQIASLALYENSGSGYATTPVWTGTGASLSQTLNLAAGSYLFKLTAIDAHGNSATSTPVAVNVTNSSLLGVVNGVEVTSAGTPQLFGWVCQSGNSAGLSYQVYLNAPTVALGGTLLTSATYTANVSGQPDDATVRAACGTAGSSHDFTLDLSSYTSQYGGTPFYVHAWDSNGDSIVLPCGADNCIIPGSLRIGLNSPSSTNTDQYNAPATVFMRATLTGASTTGANVSFIINGPSISTPSVAATADTTPGTYYASVPNLGAGTYTVTAMVQQNGENLYSSENIVTVVPGSGSTLTLTSPTAGAQSAPITLAATVGGTSVSGAVVQFYANGGAIGSTNTPNVSGVATFAWTPSQSGTYAITARMFSGSGATLAETATTTITVSGSSSSTLTPISATPTAVNIIPPYLNNPDGGSLPGNLSVDSSGAATYGIPIAVPPGTAGLAPTLGLSYSSLAGNGIAGFGWSLTGGSVIALCNKTMAQDAVNQPAAALCLDGNRLNQVSGISGQVGAIYRTEIDNFARITAITGVNGGLAFTVESKTGTTAYYGNTADSIFNAGTAPGIWYLAQVSDRAGNTMTYHYQHDTTSGQNTGETLLTSINYGNSATQYNSVVFGYECRNGTTAAYCTGGDANIVYFVGSRQDLRHRLKTISTYTDGTNSSIGTLVQTTNLSYGVSAVSQRSLLQQVQACAANGACLPPTTFTWGTANPGSSNTFASAGLMSTQNSPPQDWGVQPLDKSYAPGVPRNPGFDYQTIVGTMISGNFYGDGKQRILTASQGEGAGDSGSGWHIYTVDAAGSDFTRKDLSFSGLPAQTVLDFGVPNANASGADFSVLPKPAFNGPILTGDFDGDGITDIAFFDASNAGSSKVGAYVGSNLWVVCLSRMATLTSGFECKSFDLGTIVNDNGATKAAMTASNGSNLRMLPSPTGDRTQITFYPQQNDSSNTANAQTCGMSVSSTDTWTWTCNAVAVAPNSQLASFAAPSQSFNGNFSSSGLSYLLTQWSVPAFNNYSLNTSGLIATDTQNYVTGSATQFAWAGASQNAALTMARYVVRESRGVEMSGTPVGDLNGDGYDDYLMTFEGHAEVCYSESVGQGQLGLTFNCQLIEDLTPSNWTTSNGTVSTGLTLTPQSDGTVGISGGLQSVFSVMSVGHVNDTNLTEVLYRRGDGGAYNAGKGGVGGNQFLVCRIYDNTKTCAPWTGPNIRPYASGSDQLGNAIPGIIFTSTGAANVASTSTVNWPVAGTMTGDFLGTGRLQILWYCNDAAQPEGKGWQLYTPQVSGPIDRLVQVVNGSGNTASVTYKPMSDPSVYTPSIGSVAYPLQNVNGGGLMLASTLNLDGGSGNVLTSTYNYEGLVSDVTGRGTQGFAQATMVNSIGTTLVTQHAQSFPYTGMELGHKVTSSTGVVLEQTSNTLVTLNTIYTGGAVTRNTGFYPSVQLVAATVSAIYPYLQLSKQIVHQDLSGAPLPLVSTNIPANGMDIYGDVTQSIVTTVGPASQPGTYTTTTNNIYFNQPTGSPYLIGELTYSQVTNTAPGQSAITRTKQYDYYGPGATPVCTPATVSGLQGTPGSLKDIITEPCNPALSVQSTFGYDSFGNVSSTTQNWVDPSNNNASTSRMLNSTQYDVLGRFALTAVNAIGNASGNPTGQSTSFTYDDASGVMTSRTDQNGLTTHWTVDGFGRIVKKVLPDGNETDYYLKQCGSVCPTIVRNVPSGGSTLSVSETPFSVAIVDHLNGGSRVATPSLAYSDTAGNLLRGQSYGSLGTEIDTDYVYDQYSRLSASFQPTFAGSTPVLAGSKQYDALGRDASVVNLDESGALQTTSIFYNGLSQSVTNPKGQTKLKQSDALGQLIQTIDAYGDPAASSVTMTRDAFGNVLTTTDANNNVITVVYDNLGRKTDLHDPDLGWIHYAIDPRGLTWQQTTPNERANNQTPSTYQYDLLDRMTGRYEPDLESHWVYDQQPSASGCAGSTSCGQLLEAYSLYGGVKDYDRLQTYDKLARPIGAATTVSTTIYTSTTAYDAWGRVSTTGQQAGVGAATKNFDLRYNGFGFLAQVIRDSNNQVLWQANQSDASSRLLQAQLGNGLAINRSYNSNTGRMDEDDLDGTGGAPAIQQSYQYDVLGNVSNRVQYWNSGAVGFSESFTYDALNRLQASTVTNSSGTQTTQSVTFDATGNILSKTGVGSYSYLTNGVTQPHAVSLTAMGQFSYDADGNQTAVANPGATVRSTTWNSFDMPVTITEGANSSHFVYGPEHQRTLQTRGDGSTIVYAGAMETDIASGGAVTQKTYWPMGLGVEIDAPNAATALYWTHTDKLGSVIATTDQNGNQQDMSYDAWGARRNLNGVGAPANLSPPDDKGYTGQEMLDQLALVHMNGRVYDPLTGRFLSADSILQDPTSSQSYNRYSYVWNNPTNATDPSGYLSLFGIHILPGLFNNGNIKIGAAVVVAVFAPYISAYVGWTGAVVDGVATAGGVSGSLGLSGAVGSGILGGAAAGGIMGGTLQSAVVGGFTGGAFGAVGDAWKVPGSMGNVLGHAAVGCASGLMSGTGCGTGALSAGFSAAAAPYVSVLGPVGGTVASAVVGGTASVLGGGTFESGAVMGAEGYLFNQLAGHGMSFPGSETINIGDVNAQAVMNSPDVAIGQAINQATWVAPGSPDFVTFSADIYIASLSVTYTRFGDIYTGDGVSRAYPSPLSIGFSVSGGYMLSCAQTSQDVLNQFISGWSASGGYYRGVGGSVSANLSGAAVNIGLGFGGGGISPGAVNKPRGNIGGKP